MLVARYTQVRGDLLVAAGRLPERGPDLPHGIDEKFQFAKVCADLLRSARIELESRRPNLPVVANLLGLADRMLASLLAEQILRIRLQSVLAALYDLTPRPTAQITTIRKLALRLDRGEEVDFEDQQTAYKDALTYIGMCDQRDLIEDDLQVSRLNTLLGMILLGWGLLMCAVPFISTDLVRDDIEIWPILHLGLGESWDLVAAAGGLSIVGAVGGIISGMLSVRDSRATLLEYRTSMRKLALKPAVGAVAALIVYFFLSAGVVNGLEVTSAGVYIVAAFVAGFSERYLLNVINAQIGDDTNTYGARDGRSNVRPIEDQRDASEDGHEVSATS
jgi:hypothetical protein